MFAGTMLEKALFGAILGSASQAGEIDKHGDFLPVTNRLRGEVEVEVHLAVGDVGLVRQLEQLAAKGGDGGFGCDGHFDRLTALRRMLLLPSIPTGLRTMGGGGWLRLLCIIRSGTTTALIRDSMIP